MGHGAGDATVTVGTGGVGDAAGAGDAAEYSFPAGRAGIASGGYGRFGTTGKPFTPRRGKVSSRTSYL